MVVLLDFSDEDALHVLALVVEVGVAIVVVVHVQNALSELWLSDLSVDHKEINHRKYLEDYLLVGVEIADCFEGQVAFFSFGFP